MNRLTFFVETADHFGVVRIGSFGHSGVIGHAFVQIEHVLRRRLQIPVRSGYTKDLHSGHMKLKVRHFFQGSKRT